MRRYDALARHERAQHADSQIKVFNLGIVLKKNQSKNAHRVGNGGEDMEYEVRYPSPVGLLTMRAGEEGITVLVLPEDKQAETLLAPPATPCQREDAPPALARAARWLDAYFAGRAPDPSDLPLAPAGTPFQKTVWRALRDIPFGRTVTYGQLAELLGTSPRAVGGAVGRNPISIVVPCHRVVGTDGSLTGYAGGLEAKRFLLALEGVPA